MEVVNLNSEERPKRVLRNPKYCRETFTKEFANFLIQIYRPFILFC